MDRSVATYSAYATAGIGRTIRDALAEVASLIFASAPFQPRQSLKREVQSLVEPHLAILVHKRSRCLASMDGADRWLKELENFVNRSLFWPAPAGNESYAQVSRKELAGMVDRMVADEQQKQAAGQAVLPSTSRFDSYWAD